MYPIESVTNTLVRLMIADRPLGPKSTALIDPHQVQIMLFVLCGLYEYNTNKHLINESWFVWRIGPMTSSLYKRVIRPLSVGYFEGRTPMYPYLCSINSHNVDFCKGPVVQSSCASVVELLGNVSTADQYRMVRDRWPLERNAVSLNVASKDLAEWAMSLQLERSGA